MKNNLATLPFTIKFLLLFFAFQGVIISFIGLTTPGGLYIRWLDEHLNIIKLWRKLLIDCTALVLKTIGYNVNVNTTGLKLKGYAGFHIVYSCLGYGVNNVLLAFLVAYPKSTFRKYCIFILCTLYIQILNITRLCLIAIYYRPAFRFFGMGYHEFFNLFLYAFTILGIYLCIQYKTIN